MFGKLFSSGKPNDKRTLPTLSAATKSAISDAVGKNSIPFMPNTAQQAFKLSTNPNAEIRDFIDVIESDESLSARILKVANSVYFDRGHPAQSVNDAVNVIGLSELKGMLNAQAITQLFPSKHPIRAALWANAVATAIAARSIAKIVLPSKADSAFLVGLLHDVGKLLLLQRNVDTYIKVCKTVQSAGVSFCESEAEHYPFDHTEVGQLIGERWNFTDEVMHGVRMHHKSWSELPKNEITSIVKAADLMAHSQALGHGPEWGLLKRAASKELEEAGAALSITQHQLTELGNSVARSFESEFELYSSWGK